MSKSDPTLAERSARLRNKRKQDGIVEYRVWVPISCIPVIKAKVGRVLDEFERNKK